MRHLGDLDWVWQFGLYPIDETHTRLVSRSRVCAHTAGTRLLTLAIEPAGFVMTRRMLLGITQRAERLLRQADRHRLGPRVSDGDHVTDLQAVQ